MQAPVTGSLDVCTLLDRAKNAYLENLMSLQSQVLNLQAELAVRHIEPVVQKTYETRPKRSFANDHGPGSVPMPADINPKHMCDESESTIPQHVEMSSECLGSETGDEHNEDIVGIEGIEGDEGGGESKQNFEQASSSRPWRNSFRETVLNRLGSWVKKNEMPNLMAAELKSLRRSLREGNYEGLGFIERVVNSKLFESLANIIILLNCIAMGVEANGVAGKPYPAHVVTHLAWCDHVFTMFFTIELAMRVKTFGLRSYWPDRSENHWNFFDAILVIFTGIFISWILPLMTMMFDMNTSGETWQLLTVFRVCRLARLFKVVSRLPMFHEAWILIRGLSDSLRTLFWTCVVIFFVTYIFAIFGCSLISSQLCLIYEEALDPSTSHLYTETDRVMLVELLGRLRGLDRFMYSLIQVLTLDSFHAFITPLQNLKGLGWSWAYWYAYIAVAVFVLMNLVTAIVVENAVDHAQKDAQQAVEQKEREWKRQIKELEKLFILADVDSSGSLSWDEFKDSFSNEMIAAKWKLLGFREHECAELFCLLDDGDLEIQTDEFFDGLQRMRGNATSKDVFRLQKSLNAVYEVVHNLQKSNINSHQRGFQFADLIKPDSSPRDGSDIANTD